MDGLCARSLVRRTRVLSGATSPARSRSWFVSGLLRHIPASRLGNTFPRSASPTQDGIRHTRGAENSFQSLDHMLGQRGSAKVADRGVHVVRNPLEDHLTTVKHRVAGLAPAVAGEPDTPWVDDGYLAERTHALNMGVPQEYEVAVQFSDEFTPLIHGQVGEKVSLGGRVGHAEVSPLPLEPRERGQPAQGLAIGVAQQRPVP